MGNIGTANIGVNIDLNSIQPELNQLFELFDRTVDKIKSALNIKIDGVNTDEVKHGLDGVGKGADDAGGHIEKLGEKGTESIDKLLRFEVVKAAIDGLKQAFTGVKDFVMGFVDDFAAADLATQKLRSGLERIKQGDWFDRLIQQASELSKITPFDDDDITNMQSMLLTFDGISAQAVQKLTPAMLNLASAFAQGGDTGMGLTQVAMLIGKAAGAELYTALQRVGIVMTDAQKKLLETAAPMERINVLLEVMSQNGNITAETFGKTLAGQLQIAKNELGNVSESIGEVLAPYILMIIDYLKSFAENLQKLPDAAKLAIVAIGAIFIAVSALIAVFTVLDVVTGGVLLALGILATEVAGFAVLIISNIDNIKNWINEHEELQTQILILRDDFNKLIKTIKDVWTEIQSLIGTTDSFKQIILKLVETELRGLIFALQIIARVLNEVFSAIDLVIKGFNFLKNVVLAVIDVFRNAIPSTMLDSINSFVDKAIGKISALKNTVFSLFGMSDANSSVNDNAGALYAGESSVGTWKAGQYAPKTQAPKTEGKGGDKKEEDPYKEETKNLKDVITLQDKKLQNVEREIQLGKLTPIALLEQISLYKKALMEQQGILEKEENKLDVDNKILELKNRENKILNLNNDELKDAIALGKKISDADKKKFADEMQLQAKGYEELKNKRISNETDVYQKQIDSVNAKWDKEDERINLTYAALDIKEELLAENKKARLEELRQIELNDTSSLLNWTMQGFNSVQSAVQSGFSSMWVSVFGQADNLFQKFMQKIFEAFMAFAATAVFKLIMAVLNPAGTLLDFGGTVNAGPETSAGFGVGGYTGDGHPDDAAGIVHRKEFVISERGTTPENMPLLEALNRGERASNILKRYRVANTDFSGYANSGNISSSRNNASGTININVGGLRVSTKALTGLPKSELIKLVDTELMPELSASLHRFGKKVIDTSFKK